jgi:hypothetical protein
MSPSGNRFLALCTAGVIACAPAAFAADSGRASDIHQQYLRERAECLSGKSTEDQKTCLREAGAAQAEARHGTLGEAQPDYAKNRLARCAYHKDPKEREYCLRRMRGEGSVSGSVAEGAIVRTLVVTEPASK